MKIVSQKGEKSKNNYDEVDNAIHRDSINEEDLSDEDDDVSTVRFKSVK